MKHDNTDSKNKHEATNMKHKKSVALRTQWLSVSKAETGILQKKQPWSANALSVKDLEKLNEEELKLLPLKDFWDATKKEWKKNVFGTFAKRNSVTMKKIFGLAWSS